MSHSSMKGARSADEILSLLEAAVERGKNLEGIEAIYLGQSGHHMRLAESKVIQSSLVDESALRIRAVHAGAEACVETNRLTAQGIADAVARAESLVKATPPPAEPVELPTSGVGTAENPALSAANHEAVLENGPSEKSALLHEALLAHEKDDLSLAGRFHTGQQVQAIRSSNGVAGYHEGTFCDLALSSLDRPAGHGGSSHRERVDANFDPDRIVALAEETRAECHQAKDPVVPELGDWDVVLAPAALAELLSWLAGIGFSSDAWDDGMSFIHGRIDERVTGGAITLVDDGQMPTGMGLPIPWDVEGQPKVRVPLLEGGVARGIVHNWKSARGAGCASTGHAIRRQFSPGGGSSPTHLHLSPGNASLDDLIGQVDRGLYVTRFHYVNGLIEPRRAVMTGLLRDAAFKIEGGKIGAPIQSMRFNDSILEAFERIDGDGSIGRDLSPHGLGYSLDGGIVCPPVLIRGLHFSSGR
jgi:predicted Zn-dependent protease